MHVINISYNIQLMMVDWSIVFFSAANLSLEAHRLTLNTNKIFSYRL